METAAGQSVWEKCGHIVGILRAENVRKCPELGPSLALIKEPHHSLIGPKNPLSEKEK